LGGYWVWGQVERQLNGLTVDLLAEPPESATPMDAAVRLATGKFREQLEKAGLPLSLVRAATLNVSLGAEKVRDRINDHDAEGHIATFRVTAKLDNGRDLERALSVFVAPHDPRLEFRSSREEEA
jgi:hypothetical protein